jgi:hypothetical protein
MPDAIPVISAVDKVPGFFIATGFSGHGFGIGPGAGRLIAEMVIGATPVVNSDALSLVTLHRRLEPEATPASKLKLPHLNAQTRGRCGQSIILTLCVSVFRLSLRCGISIRSISLVGQEWTSDVT